MGFGLDNRDRREKRDLTPLNFPFEFLLLDKAVITEISDWENFGLDIKKKGL